MKNINLKNLLVRPEVATFIMFVVIMIGFYIANERFLDARNIRIVMGITPEYIIVAIGIAILMISGEFDLSVGSVLHLFQWQWFKWYIKEFLLGLQFF